MKIAIHNRPGSFSDRWVAYCKKNSIDYIIVNCYDSDIINQLKEIAGLMWHWNHGDYREHQFARQLIYSLQIIGIKVFPDFNTCWHYDDKVGQKYLLESIGAPLVPSYVFYNKEDAITWINTSRFPVVFKLRGGAGSLNVKLVKNRIAAIKLTCQAFGRGFSLVDKYSGLKQRFWVLRRDKNMKSVIHVLKGIVGLFWQKSSTNLLPTQKGYVYFQKFIPHNKYDIRVVVIGNRSIAFRRYIRENDFRASGSGLFDHNPEIIDKNVIRLAFDISEKIKSQVMAFDIIYEEANNPLIVEISYAFTMSGETNNCPGYWDRDLNWHDDDVNPQRYMIEDFLKSIQTNV